MSQTAFSGIEWLVGEWQGYGIIGKQYNLIRKTFDYELSGAVLVERTLSMSPPGAPSGDYEIHQDFVVFHPSGDKLLAKGFYVEGFVSLAEVDISEDGNTIVIETTSVENGPPGHHTRYTLTRQGEDAFEGVFEIAWTGGDLELSQKIKMQRKP